MILQKLTGDFSEVNVDSMGLWIKLNTMEFLSQFLYLSALKVISITHA